MKDSFAVTESKLWAEADPRQKSYVVQILHWFHYRPMRLRASWRQEEVLTWELIRALDVLPQRLFLHPLLAKIASLSPKAATAVQSLGGRRTTVTPYPSLELSGGKRNCKSDIGIGLDGRPIIWIEAKTASFRASDLEQQLRQQELAMVELLPGVPKVLITLLPAARALGTFSNLSWDDVLSALHTFDDAIVRAAVEPDLAHGYRILASELVGRIESHPNRAKGWL